MILFRNFVFISSRRPTDPERALTSEQDIQLIPLWVESWFEYEKLYRNKHEYSLSEWVDRELVKCGLDGLEITGVIGHPDFRQTVKDAGYKFGYFVGERGEANKLIIEGG